METKSVYFSAAAPNFGCGKHAPTVNFGSSAGSDSFDSSQTNGQEENKPWHKAIWYGAGGLLALGIGVVASRVMRPACFKDLKNLVCESKGVYKLVSEEAKTTWEFTKHDKKGFFGLFHKINVKSTPHGGGETTEKAYYAFRAPSDFRNLVIKGPDKYFLGALNWADKEIGGSKYAVAKAMDGSQREIRVGGVKGKDLYTVHYKEGNSDTLTGLTTEGKLHEFKWEELPSPLRWLLFQKNFLKS